MKNYYLILGVESDATMEQIRAAYIRQAKDLHPDYYGQDISPFIDLWETKWIFPSHFVLKWPENGQENHRDDK